MSARAGTSIPLGMAEKALAFLCRHTKALWAFLKKDIVHSSKEQGTAKGGRRAEFLESGVVSDMSRIKPNGSGADDSGNDGESSWKRGVRGGQPRDKDDIDDATETYPLSRISSALEAFARSLGDHGASPEEFPLHDLINFLYLGGQAKVRDQANGSLRVGCSKKVVLATRIVLGVKQDVPSRVCLEAFFKGLVSCQSSPRDYCLSGRRLSTRHAFLRQSTYVTTMHKQTHGKHRDCRTLLL